MTTPRRQESSDLTMITNRRYIRGELEKRRELLYRLAYSWCHNSALADDLVQDAMVKALKNARQLKDAAAIKSWLSKILANCWFD